LTDSRLHITLVPGPVAYMDGPTLPEGGGECVFLGRTRAETHPKHGPLTLLRYTAYESMAIKVLTALAQQAVDEHSALFVRLAHSIGEVAIGEASVLVQVICPHRAEAFAACRMLIDRLKAEAPIWKSEVWADGTTWSRGQAINPEVFADHEGHPAPFEVIPEEGENEEDESP